jgi:hypothetical protein
VRPARARALRCEPGSSVPQTAVRCRPVPSELRVRDAPCHPVSATLTCPAPAMLRLHAPGPKRHLLDLATPDRAARRVQIARPTAADVARPAPGVPCGSPPGGRGDGAPPLRDLPPGEGLSRMSQQLGNQVDMPRRCPDLRPGIQVRPQDQHLLMPRRPSKHVMPEPADRRHFKALREDNVSKASRS